MLNLLRADLMRLKREKAFYIGIFAMIIMSLSIVFNTLRENMTVSEFPTESSDGFMMTGGLLVGITSAVFTAFFIGAGYSDGTIRNKIIAGHSRTSIYLSDLITCAIASFIQHAAFLVTTSVFGSVFIGKLKTPPPELTVMVIVSFLAVLALTAIFVMLALLIPNRAAIAIILVAALILLGGAFMAFSKLAEPEFYDRIIYAGSDGIQSSRQVLNPSYPRGIWRQIYAFIRDFLPNGQIIQLGNLMGEFGSGLEPAIKPQMIGAFIAYSSVITLISTGVGIFLFKRKDLK